ncbi:MAG TPA: DUF1080 domain-containing protein [Bacteroidales bacterium]|jgi:hypothetical protein|nr:DUF1080 domain-containing protein [Bacteroidales bacterium]OQB60910.1 MAG: hypothetical protein BWX96_01963 [Bacteroidetes bacterium ADurb.Bin145]NMD02319.1 DUF1080 domain-containing protein [Bacteroidales bacterium]HOU02399.1 DUF1080 domain-containing protein [Bacteroidales bacterium]HQG63532.1 DUF1080 domain-containing protein [Bacteroidales bacterium]
MRTRINLTALFLVSVMACLSLKVQAEPNTKEKKAKKQKTETVKLFNGKDLNNWAFMLRDQSVKPESVFFIKDGVIHITGNPFGYMRTKDSYSDYNLHLEWRYPVEATNSGVFINVQLPDTIWPKCFECQLKAGSAGDFICMSGSDMNERTDKTVRVINKLAPSAEKPTGEWNTMEIVTRGNTIEVTLNGVLMNKATGTNPGSGHICLQSEGKDIQFRNVYLTRPKK